jgi:hypothetical protein
MCYFFLKISWWRPRTNWSCVYLLIFWYNGTSHDSHGSTDLGIGPLYLHEMWSYERFMSVLSRYVHNWAFPKGTMIEGYSSEEVIECCQEYLKVQRGIGKCWLSLTSTLYLQLRHNIMVKGLLVHSCMVYSDKFHELCCSHLFCRIIDISPHKSISNNKTDHTIVKILSRRSKQTYHLLYLESWRECPRWIRLEILWNTPEPSLSKSFMD